MCLFILLTGPALRFGLMGHGLLPRKATSVWSHELVSNNIFESISTLLNRFSKNSKVVIIIHNVYSLFLIPFKSPLFNLIVYTFIIVQSDNCHLLVVAPCPIWLTSMPQ